MTYPKSQARWDKENTLIFSVKFFKRSEQDLIDFMDSKVDKSKGIGRGTVLKEALRYYMENHKEEYRYGMRLRGYSPGSQPKGVLRCESDSTGKYHDILVYDRQLSADEMNDYDLDELKEEK